MSASGLARAAGLDATAFNKSKRATPNGKLRWPTTESVAKCLDATGTNLIDFAGLVQDARSLRRMIPVVGLQQAGANGLFDDAGRPAGSGWEQTSFPGIDDPCAFALEISGDGMAPVFRDGDTIIVSPEAPVRNGDRIVVNTGAGEVLIRQLHQDTGNNVQFAGFNLQTPMLAIKRSEINWMARIVWTSQ